MGDERHLLGVGLLGGVAKGTRELYKSPVDDKTIV
jgi:hypothetical protein